HALTIAQARDFVEALTYQLHDMISQRGENLSGGQKQRIAIARAVVKKAEFTLFDDSFSALDFTTEVKLRKALKEELAASTILIVAQRIGTIIDADLILVIDEGKIVGAGTHRQLLKDCEMYREIAYSQLTKEDLA
nr:ABC transporter ATP-binding protein [Clostridiales bacterium]